MEGVPEDEIVLAKMIQSAKARGLKPTCGAFYRDAGGSWTNNPSEAVECCAVGAWMLDEGSDAPLNVVHGNDGIIVPDLGANFSGLSIGAAFQDAMRDD